jgi:hypothetical protein
MTHGHAKRLSRTKTYSCWAHIIQRCKNENDSAYKNYGGRGIKVCERWYKFENFLTDMGEQPPRHSIERIDNNGNYSPENCKWATYKEQHNNKRVNHWIEFNNQRKTLRQWADKLGINKSTLSKRINRSNWPIEKALSP